MNCYIVVQLYKPYWIESESIKRFQKSAEILLFCIDTTIQCEGQLSQCIEKWITWENKFWKAQWVFSTYFA